MNTLQSWVKGLKTATAGLSLPIAVALIGILTLLPVLVARQVSAAGQLTARSLAISSGVPGKTGVQYTFTFTPQATSTLQSMKFQACTTAVGTCTAPTGLSFSSAAWVSQNAGWQGAVNFATGAGSNDCTASVSIICATRSSGTNQTVTSRNIVFGTITNPTTANTSFFVRISTYSDAAYTLANIQDTGTVASAVVQTLTVSANVSEVLNFCVGTTTVNSTSGDDSSNVIATDCLGVSGTALSLGNLDSSRTNVSPVSGTNGGDGNNAVAMLRTNATGGSTVAYDAVQASGGSNHFGTLRLSTPTCNAGNVSTDGCINAQGTTQGTFTAGTEKFGMTVAAINCGGNSQSNYTCNFGASSYNLTRTTNYDGTGSNTFPTDTDAVAGVTNAGYAWDESGTAQNIATSSTYVEDEALLLKFAATVAITAPFGSYTVQSDFIAVPTF